MNLIVLLFLKISYTEIEEKDVRGQCQKGVLSEKLSKAFLVLINFQHFKHYLFGNLLVYVTGNV